MARLLRRVFGRTSGTVYTAYRHAANPADAVDLADKTVALNVKPRPNY